jgi:hypothetical protein
MGDFGVTCIASPVAVSFGLVEINVAVARHTAALRGRRRRRRAPTLHRSWPASWPLRLRCPWRREEAKRDGKQFFY